MQKRKTHKYALIAKLSDEAVRLMTPTPEWQHNMFRVAATKGRENEPVGFLAEGAHPDNMDTPGR
ncbi:hypothetical protein [Pseudomonas sp.]|uniref:hypothetical protein n=1 Tax=Pseudomonas sp. TaxID=306 RepID=UPI0027308F34|nr:hypothetical protein [Pseudomonas sp.]MDP2243174.1 hypothetical protein [Pseudomonas sp.]